jgi:hypothetical protein
MALSDATWHYHTRHGSTLPCMALPDATWHYLTVYGIARRDMAVPYLAWHYQTRHGITTHSRPHRTRSMTSGTAHGRTATDGLQAEEESMDGLGRRGTGQAGAQARELLVHPTTATAATTTTTALDIHAARLGPREPVARRARSWTCTKPLTPSTQPPIHPQSRERMAPATHGNANANAKEYRSGHELAYHILVHVLCNNRYSSLASPKI